jgi:hypothetical protein
MVLPHYNQDQTQRKNRNFEPVTPNLFEVTFIPPEPVQDGPLLLQHVNTVSGLGQLHPELPVIEQSNKWATRSFSSVPESTAIDITVNFSLNLNDSNQAYVYKTLRQWYRLQYNPETGEKGLKRNYVGTLIVTEFDSPGNVYRKVTLEDCFISSGLPFNAEQDYSNSEPATLEVTWRSDVYSEQLQ